MIVKLNNVYNALFVDSQTWVEVNFYIISGGSSITKFENPWLKVKITSWSWALLEKPPVVKPLKNFPTFYGTRRFIIVFTGPYPEPDRSSPYHPILSYSLLLLLLLLFILTANGFLSGGSCITIRYNTQITHITQDNTSRSNKTQHTKLHKQ
jgi:hypothetical protein